ncbi:MAG: hypothetical protein SAMD01599839_01360 [Rectinema sp.]
MNTSLNRRLDNLEMKISQVDGLPPIAFLKDDGLYYCPCLPPMTKEEHLACCKPWADIGIPAIVITTKQEKEL